MPVAPNEGVGILRPAGVMPSIIPSPLGVPKFSRLAEGDAMLPVWLKLWIIGVLVMVLLPVEPVVAWLTGVLPARLRAVAGDGTLRGGED